MATLTDTGQSSAIPLQLQPVQGESNILRRLRQLRKHRMAVFGFMILGSIVLYVVIGSFIIPESQANFNDPSRQLEAPSQAHPFGLDDIGRDILARTIWGGQISLIIGVMAVCVQLMVGTAVGLAAGYFGGVVDNVLMRIVEALLSIPQLFVLIIATRVFADKLPDFTIGGRVFSSTLIVIIFAIGLTSWMRLARIVRSAVLSVKAQEYITAAHSIGTSHWRILTRHILPNCMAPIIVSATLGVAVAILLEAYLGFLGLGVRAPTATWGNMLDDAYAHLNTWYYWFWPAVFIILTSLGINFFGDGLRDALDPHSVK